MHAVQGLCGGAGQNLQFIFCALLPSLDSPKWSLQRFPHRAFDVYNGVDRCTGTINHSWILSFLSLGCMMPLPILSSGSSKGLSVDMCKLAHSLLEIESQEVYILAAPGHLQPFFLLKNAMSFFLLLNS